MHFLYICAYKQYYKTHIYTYSIVSQIHIIHLYLSYISYIQLLLTYAQYVCGYDIPGAGPDEGVPGPVPLVRPIISLYTGK